MRIVLPLLVLWAIVAIIGFAFKALVGLAILGLVLFIATTVFGALRSGAPKRG